MVDTREQAAALNAAIRDRLVTTGVVDDQHTTSTAAGQSIGAGDRIVTRRNDTSLGVANREAWTVTGVHRDGRLTITADGRGSRELPAGYVREHVELGYAVTGYGAQGDTTDTAHLILTEQTSAASAYVAMTRGRHANTVHLVADDLDDAREQWVAAFARDRADHGPDAARHAAEQAAAGYSPAPVPADPEELAAALDRLRTAWDTQAAAHAALDLIRQRVEALQRLADQWSHSQALLAPLVERMTTTGEAAACATAAAQASSEALAEVARAYRDELERAWYADRPTARDAARVIAEGSGRLGLHRGRARAARAELDAWADRWADVLTDAGITIEQLRDPTRWYLADDAARSTFAGRAEQRAAGEHPNHPELLATAEIASAEAGAARRAFFDAQDRLVRQGTMPAHSPSRHLTGQTAQLRTAERQAARADTQVATLSSDPAIISQPDPKRLLDIAQAGWRHDRDRTTREPADWKIPDARDELRRIAAAREVEYHHHAPTVRHGPSIGC